LCTGNTIFLPIAKKEEKGIVDVAKQWKTFSKNPLNQNRIKIIVVVGYQASVAKKMLQVVV
jgi:hypothetical protein